MVLVMSVTWSLPYNRDHVSHPYFSSHTSLEGPFSDVKKKKTVSACHKQGWCYWILFPKLLHRNDGDCKTEEKTHVEIA